VRLFANERVRVNRIIGDYFEETSDDLTNPDMRWQTGDIYLSSSQVYVLAPSEDTLFIGIPRNSILFEAHVISEKPGKKTIQDGMKAMSWMFENTDCLKIEAYVPGCNNMARALAVRCGMEFEGVSKKSFLKNGELHNMNIYGIQKEAWLCQQQ